MGAINSRGRASRHGFPRPYASQAWLQPSCLSTRVWPSRSVGATEHTGHQAERGVLETASR